VARGLQSLLLFKKESGQGVIADKFSFFSVFSFFSSFSSPLEYILSLITSRRNMVESSRAGDSKRFSRNTFSRYHVD
jgi:hypothetical protein